MKKINGRLSRVSQYSGRALVHGRRRGAQETSGSMRVSSLAVKEQEPAGEEFDRDATAKWCVDESSVRMRAQFRRVADEVPRESADAIPTTPETELTKPSAALLARVTAGCRKLGPYSLICELSSGGMGTVYLAVNKRSQGFEKFIAVKTIHKHLAHDPEFAQMFVDEARYAGAINHPNVCSVFDFGHVADDYFIAMEFLQGKPLSRVIWEAVQNGAAFSSARYPRIIARIIADVAEGLNAVHSLKDEHGQPLELVHRDVTPQNLFVLFDGTVRVTDLGIARARERLHHTHGYAIKGKLAYMAPEQLQRRPLDTRVDIWALGVVLWELLTLHRLFRGSNEGETVLAVSSRSIPSPSTLNPNVPKQLDDIVMKALQRDPDRRYQCVRELSRDLEAFLAHSADTVPCMDVAEWMAELFPHGAAEHEQLIWVAREAMLHPRHDRKAQAASWKVDSFRDPNEEPTQIEGCALRKSARVRRLELGLALSCTLLVALAVFFVYQLAF